MAIESARQAAKAHMVEMAESKCTAVLNERNLDSKVANLTSRFQCGQSGEELENRFAELSARSEARQQILSNESALMETHTQEIQGSAGCLKDSTSRRVTTLSTTHVASCKVVQSAQMARCRRMSSKIVRVSSRLCGEFSLSSLDDVARITTTEQIAWRARR